MRRYFTSVDASGLVRNVGPFFLGRRRGAKFSGFDLEPLLDSEAFYVSGIDCSGGFARNVIWSRYSVVFRGPCNLAKL